MMFQVGEYVEVELENETRRGIVATCVEDNKVDIILLKEYGNSRSTEEVDPHDLSPVRIESVKRLSTEDLIPIPSISSIESLRDRASRFFRARDWRGAICAYREILYRMECSDTDNYFLIRAANKIRVNRATDENYYVDCGVVDPSSQTQMSLLATQSFPLVNVNQNSIYRIYQPFHLHSTILLNLGRSLLNAGFTEESIHTLSYALYISALSQNEQGFQLRSKCFFWRARARMESSQHEAALRDAQRASELANSETRAECELLSRNCQVILHEHRNGMRLITREFMKLIDKKIRDGSVDFSI
jgi:hypothetical protein